MGMKFFLNIVPPTVTHQQKKIAVVNGRPRVYDPERLASARELLTLHLKRYRPKKPYTCGLRLGVKWYFPRGRHKDGEYRTTRPDTDNLQKLLKDCMTAVGFWKDDALVAVEHVEKVWSDRPGIWILIDEL